MGGLLHHGDPGYGPVCPECGGPKDVRSPRCVYCRHGRQPGDDVPGRVAGEDAVHTVGRRESIITFRNRETGALLTRHCHGPTMPAQVADGRRGLGEEWVVECRSTPASILIDLQGRKVQERHGPVRRLT